MADTHGCNDGIIDNCGCIIGLYGDTGFISPHYVHGTRKFNNAVAS